MNNIAPTAAAVPERIFHSLNPITRPRRFGPNYDEPAFFRAQIPHVPPCFAQYLHDEQVRHALQGFDPVQVAAWRIERNEKPAIVTAVPRKRETKRRRFMAGAFGYGDKTSTAPATAPQHEGEQPKGWGIKMLSLPVRRRSNNTAALAN